MRHTTWQRVYPLRVGVSVGSLAVVLEARYHLSAVESAPGCSPAPQRSVAGEDQHLYGHQQRLHSQNDGVNHADGVDHVQE